ncbi:MAG: hypothetical protein NWP50_00695, partial [Schleiferiaceae bacterium]|nr:hypothetical protein [Schleiferiaceae bacterium]
MSQLFGKPARQASRNSDSRNLKKESRLLKWAGFLLGDGFSLPDGFFAQDGHIRFVPERYIPMDTLLELYADLRQEIDADTIDRAVSLMEQIYVNPNGGAVAESLGAQVYNDLQTGIK